MARRSTRKGQVRKTARRAYAPKPKRRSRRTSPALIKARTQLARSRTNARKLRRETGNPSAAKALGLGVYGGTLVTAGGGAVAGVVDSLVPSIWGLDPKLLTGVALTIWAGMAKSDAAAIGGAVGAGMLAVVAADMTSNGFTMFGGDTATLNATGTDGVS